MDNLEEIDKFLEKFKLLRMNQEEVEIMNKLVISTEIKIVIKNLSSSPTQKKINKRKKQSPGPDRFTGECHQTLIESIMPILLKLFQKIANERIFPNSLYKVIITLIIKSDIDIT